MNDNNISHVYLTDNSRWWNWTDDKERGDWETGWNYVTSCYNL